MEINWNTIQFEFIDDLFIKQEMEISNFQDFSPDSTLSAIDEMDFEDELGGDIDEFIKESLIDPDFNFFDLTKKVPKRKQKNGEKNFSCDICNVKLPSLSYLKRHYTTKGHQRKLMTFRKVPEVVDERIEELTELSNDEKELLALFDEQISNFQGEELFDIKEEIFLAPKPSSPPQKSQSQFSLVCSPCNKIFSHKCHYTQHVQTVHSGIKAFKCQKCGKKFSTQSQLEAHAAKHEGIKAFKCEKCPKSYNNKVDLKRHELNHGSQAPHPCEICGRGFVRKDHLEKHYQSHERKGAKQLKKVKGDQNF